MIGIPAGKESSGAGTRTPNDWTKTSRVANYTTPERRGPEDEAPEGEADRTRKFVCL